MRSFFCVCLITAIAVIAVAFFYMPANARYFKKDITDDIAVIKRRLYDTYFSQLTHKQEEAYFKSVSANGSWADVDYKNRGMADWKPIQHLYRLVEMSVAYRDPKSKFFNNKQMLDAITKALSYWFSVLPKSDNWWNNTIGSQLQLEEILILVGDELPAAVVKNGIASFVDPEHADKQWTTGQNLIWYSEEEFVKGLLENNPGEVSGGLAHIEGEVRIATSEGIQPDYSFHQHGNQLYNGGYGLEFLKDEIQMAVLVNKTAFEFSKPKLEILSNYLLLGTGDMVRGQLIDYGANGRAMVRQGASNLALGLVPLCLDMMNLLPEHKESYFALLTHIEGKGKPYSFNGNKYFWNSDFMVHQRPGYYISVKMISRGIVGTEIGNGENLKGSWMPFGLTYILRKGDEYKDIFPVWDWIKLPGITAYQDNYMEKQILVQNSECLAAGVSDGMYGAASLQLKRNSLRAKKSWFFFDDVVVALGAGISSAEPANITTTVNQCLLSGDVYIDNKILGTGEHPNIKASHIYNNGFGYIMLDAQPVNLKNANQTGSWYSVDNAFPSTVVSKPVFTLWIDHGIKPLNQSYAYAIVPCVDKEWLERYAGNLHVRIVQNDTNFQAVTDGSLKMSELAFYKAGSVKIDNGLSIESDSPALVIYSEKQNNGYKISVANLYYSDRTINVTVHKKEKSKSFKFIFIKDDTKDNTKTIIEP